MDLSGNSLVEAAREIYQATPPPFTAQNIENSLWLKSCFTYMALLHSRQKQESDCRMQGLAFLSTSWLRLPFSTTDFGWPGGAAAKHRLPA